MRSEDLYLEDISAAYLAISNFVAGISEKSFLETDIIQSAVIQKFTVIGEAASKIGDETRKDHPEIDWKTLTAFRNILVHVYFETTLEKVWEATCDVDALREHVDAIIRFRRSTQDH
jgi:uncharacterized protein with HEPN domain